MKTLVIIEAAGISKIWKRPHRTMQEPPTINQKATACKIRDYMKQNGLKPSDLQRYLGLACVQTVYRWIDGTNIPSVDHLYALSRLFCIRMDDMIAAVYREQEQSLESGDAGYLLSYYHRVKNGCRIQ